VARIATSSALLTLDGSISILLRVLFSLKYVELSPQFDGQSSWQWFQYRRCVHQFVSHETFLQLALGLTRTNIRIDSAS